MEQGLWLFRFWEILLHPYDGFTNEEEVVTNSMPIWLRIHKLEECFCNKEVVEKLINKASESQEIRISDNTRGDYT